MTRIIVKLTLMSEEGQRQMLRHFARLSLYIKLQIFDSQRSIFHQLKQNNKDIANSILTYCSLILAIKQIIESDEKLNIKALAIKQKNQRKASKRNKILSHWAIVKTLKNEQKMSFRDISRYLKKYHRFDVAHSTIFEIWNQIEK